jgi:hypothetical protein
MLLDSDKDSILEKIARKNLDRPKKLALAMSLSKPKGARRRNHYQSSTLGEADVDQNAHVLPAEAGSQYLTNLD